MGLLRDPNFYKLRGVDLIPSSFFHMEFIYDA